MNLAECQEIKRALEDGALDVLAPSSSSQKDVAEFRERVLRWIEDFDQSSNNAAGHFILTASFTKHTVTRSFITTHGPREPFRPLILLHFFLSSASLTVSDSVQPLQSAVSSDHLNLDPHFQTIMSFSLCACLCLS